jgi:hypothetical protein
LSSSTIQVVEVQQLVAEPPPMKGALHIEPVYLNQSELTLARLHLLLLLQ